MIKEIKYNGFTASPSDYECPDGDLAGAYNVIPDEGHLKPIVPPRAIHQFSTGEKIITTHETIIFKHFIKLATNGKTVSWYDKDFATEHSLKTFSTSVLKANAVGNSICILCTDGFHYFLWDNNDYKYLGQEPPSIAIGFGLSERKSASYDRSTIEAIESDIRKYYTAWRAVNISNLHDATSCMEISSDGSAVVFNSLCRSEFNNNIWALVNGANSVVTADGHFYAPFIVRYCYRLYDGTMWMHSAPVFMPVSMPTSYQIEVVNAFVDYTTNKVTNIENQLTIKDDDDAGNEKTFTLKRPAFRYRPNNVALTAKVYNPSSVATLKSDWGDIIKSVDVFISLPIIREKSDEPIISGVIAKPSYMLRADVLYSKEYPWTIAGDTNKRAKVVCDIPMLSEEAYLDKIHDTSNFYKVCSYDLSQDTLPVTERKEVPIDKSILPVLATQEVMTDDYKYHNRLIPAYNSDGECVTSMYNYNGRQHLSGIRERLFSGYNIDILMPRCEHINIGFVVDTDEITPTKVFVYLKTEYGERIVDSSAMFGSSGSLLSRIVMCSVPLFYPDSRAFKMVVRHGSDDYVMDMKACDNISGAMTRGTVLSQLTYSAVKQSSTTITTNDICELGSKIYTSEVNNPFIFTALGINTVGTGTIMALATAAKALSQGQFGQFPLYAFTSEGVWALEIETSGENTGLYRSRQPVTRDVCLSADSILQLDSSVVFASSRGIMLLSGSESICISDSLKNDTSFNLSSLPSASSLIANQLSLSATAFSYVPFLDFVKGCRMLYAYSLQRIIVFNPQYTYAYVYSLKTKTWGITASGIKYAVASYPEAYALRADGKLVDYNDVDDIPEGSTSLSNVKGVIITRPLKLMMDNLSPNVHKTVDTIIQRGHFTKGNVKSVLYGSNDLDNWSLVWSSTDHYLRGFYGTPFKYFRIMLLLDISPSESLYGCTVQFTPRYINRPR